MTLTQLKEAMDEGEFDDDEEEYEEVEEEEEEGDEETVPESRQDQ